MRNSNARMKRKHLHKNAAKALFGDKCCDCGWDDIWEVLEFHHKIPREISGRPKLNKVYEWKWEKVRDEVVEHCVLLCPTCHRARHYYEQNHIGYRDRRTESYSDLGDSSKGD